jgi:hypothetical protein
MFAYHNFLHSKLIYWFIYKIIFDIFILLQVIYKNLELIMNIHLKYEIPVRLVSFTFLYVKNRIE